MHLLMLAAFFQADDLDCFGVREVCNRRIIESDMSVLADPHAHQINAAFAEQGGIALTFPFRVRCLPVDQEHAVKRHSGEQVSMQIRTEELRGAGRETEVLVHVKRIDAFPVNGGF